MVSGRTIGSRKSSDPIEIDLKPSKNFKEEIKEILNEHPKWYLGTWFFRTWRKTNLEVGFVDETPHMVACFYTREMCVPVDRGDDLRWGLAKP